LNPNSCLVLPSHEFELSQLLKLLEAHEIGLVWVPIFFIQAKTRSNIQVKTLQCGHWFLPLLMHDGSPLPKLRDAEDLWQLPPGVKAYLIWSIGFVLILTLSFSR